eukprot:TRINITY_DN97507_c1_g4_i1.p1 TRINITY_DN97507_c1_g4~~TRINITY_DN97507_c1_g4_i1.p1  ORF type:complete len:60 (+),score=3.42 TRINITY_DN97507_c1_g4_i1:22-180(+)
MNTNSLEIVINLFLKSKKEMQTQRNLLAKGKRVKITKKDGTSYYKWKNIRKK